MAASTRLPNSLLVPVALGLLLAQLVPCTSALRLLPLPTSGVLTPSIVWREPSGRRLTEAGFVLDGAINGSICDFSDGGPQSFSSPSCSSSSNYTSLMPSSGHSLKPGHAVLLVKEYRSVQPLAALTCGGLAWDISSKVEKPATARNVFLAFGTASSTEAATACVLALLEGGHCDAKQVSFLWGSGVAADVLDNATAPRVSQPTPVPVPASATGLASVIGARPGEPWYLLSPDDVRALPQPSFVVFAAVASNAAAHINALALLGLTPVPAAQYKNGR